MDEEGERFDEGCGGATRTEKREVETRVAIGTELSRTRGAIEWRRFNGPMPARELDSDMMVKRGDDEDGTNVELGLVVLVEGVPRFGRGGLALRLRGGGQDKDRVCGTRVQGVPRGRQGF